MTKSLEEEMTSIVAKMDEKQNEQQETDKQTSPDEVQDIYVLIVRETEEEEEEQVQIVESTPTPVTTHPQKTSLLPAYAICSLYIFLILSTLAFQLYAIFNPPIATVTIIPKSETLTLNGTVQLGRVLLALTLSQSQIVHTTGRGHQDARNATGYITFYNGQFQTVTISAGLILTGSSRVQIATDQDAIIPPGNPATGYGHITVSAHAMSTGVTGNIPAYDINSACCATSILAANPYPFSGGQDERSYNVVTHNDIHNISTVLKTSLAASMQGALAAQAKQNETLVQLPCSPTVRPNHNIGDEASQVQVTVSETCQAAAYNSQLLEEKASALLTANAAKKLGTGYSLFDGVKVTTIQASATIPPHPLVFLSFQASGTWIYALSHQSQQHIREILAGKTKAQALTLLAAMPGVEQAAIRISGFTDDTKLPKNSNCIHIMLIVM